MLEDMNTRVYCNFPFFMTYFSQQRKNDKLARDFLPQRKVHFEVKFFIFIIIVIELNVIKANK